MKIVTKANDGTSLFHNILNVFPFSISLFSSICLQSPKRIKGNKKVTRPTYNCAHLRLINKKNMTTAGGNRSGVLRGRGVTRVMGVTGVTGQIAVGEETGEGEEMSPQRDRQRNNKGI